MFTKKIGILVVGLALAGRNCGATEVAISPKDSKLTMLPKNKIKGKNAIKKTLSKQGKTSMAKKKSPNNQRESQSNPSRHPRTVDEIIYAISAEEGMIYAMGKEAVFDGSAAARVHPQLAQLVDGVKVNINHYDLNDLDRLNDVLVNEIGNLYKTVLYAYDELPDYAQQEIERYRFYYITIKNQLESIVNAIRERSEEN
jgi:hypothetical protein